MPVRHEGTDRVRSCVFNIFHPTSFVSKYCYHSNMVNVLIFCTPKFLSKQHMQTVQTQNQTAPSGAV